MVWPYLCGGVDNIENGAPVLRGAHCFLLLSCSVALRFSTFATPLRRECQFRASTGATLDTCQQRLPITNQVHCCCHALCKRLLVSGLSRISKIIFQAIAKLDVFKLTNRRLMLVATIANILLWLQWRRHRIRERAAAAVV